MRGNSFVILLHWFGWLCGWLLGYLFRWLVDSPTVFLQRSSLLEMSLRLFNRFAHTAGPFSSALDFMNESVIWKPMAGGSVTGEFVYGL